MVFPTRCIYGLGGDALNPQTVKRLYQVKQRPANKPVSVLITRPADLAGLVRRVPEAAERIMNRFWPGKVTLVFETHNTRLTALTAGTGKIGIRLVENSVAHALIRAADCFLTGTSANVSSRSGCSRIETLDHEIAGGADLILDAGALAGGKGSTVVDVSCYPVRILREGVVSAQKIKAVA